MNLLIVAATPFEIAPLLTYLRTDFQEPNPWHFQKKHLEIAVLITGVGMPLTAYALGKVLAIKRYDIAIQVGIAGAFGQRWRIGDVVEVVTERFGDLGVEEADGSFTDVHTLGLIEADTPPFQHGILRNPEPGGFLPEANGLSINKVHGFAPSIERIIERYQPDIETMEGAVFFYACLSAQQPMLAIRAISNYVEPRNRNNWNIPLAIDNLHQVLIPILEEWG
jgi:futalosine hydrolase